MIPPLFFGEVMSETITPCRVMVFVDFWNYELSMKALDPTFLTDWFKLPQVIVQEVSQLLQMPAHYERCFVFGSYDSSSAKDAKLYSWATTKLSAVPGMNVRFLPRQQRTKGPQCTGPEHHEITNCPYCNASMLGTQEKGVDTQIVTEMLNKAYSNQCDTIVLVSADKDFVPAVEKLLNKGVKVIHARMSNYGYELTRKSWGNFDLFRHREKFKR